VKVGSRMPPLRSNICKSDGKTVIALNLGSSTMVMHTTDPSSAAV
jgi:hypothetical protein